MRHEADVNATNNPNAESPLHVACSVGIEVRGGGRGWRHTRVQERLWSRCARACVCMPLPISVSLCLSLSLSVSLCLSLSQCLRFVALLLTLAAPSRALHPMCWTGAGNAPDYRTAAQPRGHQRPGSPEANAASQVTPQRPCSSSVCVACVCVCLCVFVCVCVCVRVCLYAVASCFHPLPFPFSKLEN